VHPGLQPVASSPRTARFSGTAYYWVLDSSRSLLDLGFLSPPPCARAIQFGLVAADSVPRPAERFVRVLERLLASPQGIAARGACLLELPLALIRDPLSFVCDPLSLIGDPLSLIGDTVSRVGATPSLVKLAP